MQYRVLELEAQNSVSGTREALREKCGGKGKERKGKKKKKKKQAECMALTDEAKKKIDNSLTTCLTIILM